MTITITVKSRDPEAAYRRRAIAQRRVGVGAKCACGEARPEALIREKNGVICQECKRKQNGMTRKDDHHYAMKANSPITVPIPVNDHRAELNVAQQDWPKQTRENRDGSPLIAAAACIRGFIDTILYLIRAGLHWIADMLETADVCLTRKLGSKWWIGTELEKYAPSSKTTSRHEPK
jgi:hypothetical protein